MPMRNSFIPDLDFEVRIAKGLSSLQEPLSVTIVEPEGIIEKPGNFRIPTTSCDRPIIDRATEYRRGERGERGHPRSRVPETGWPLSVRAGGRPRGRSLPRPKSR